MKLATAKTFHDNVTKMLRSKDMIVVTRHGLVAGYYLPHKAETLSSDVRWKLFEASSAKIRRQMDQQGVTEKEILKDFEQWRKENKTSSRRR